MSCKPIIVFGLAIITRDRHGQHIVFRYALLPFLSILLGFIATTSSANRNTMIFLLMSSLLLYTYSLSSLWYVLRQESIRETRSMQQQSHMQPNESAAMINIRHLKSIVWILLALFPFIYILSASKNFDPNDTLILWMVWSTSCNMMYIVVAFCYVLDAARQQVRNVLHEFRRTFPTYMVDETRRPLNYVSEAVRREAMSFSSTSASTPLLHTVSDTTDSLGRYVSSDHRSENTPPSTFDINSSHEVSSLAILHFILKFYRAIVLTYLKSLLSFVWLSDLKKKKNVKRTH